MKHRSFVLSKLLLSVAILIIFFHALLIFESKNGFYLDETLTFLLSNNKVMYLDSLKDAVKNNTIDEYSEELKNDIYGNNEWVSRSEIVDRYTVNESGKFNVLNIYLLQASDVHPPLYYFLINILCSVFPSLSLYVVGFIVNVTALIFVCILIFCVGNVFFENEICSIAAMFYYGLSFDFANNLTYFRMYALLTMWCMLLLYLYIKWYRAGFDYNTYLLKWICFTEFAGMLTQYFALYFILPIFFLTIFLMLKNKINVSIYIIKSVITGGIYAIIWPFFFVHIFLSDRGNDVTGNLVSSGGISRLFGYRECVKKSLFANSPKIMLLFIMVVIISIIADILNVRNNQKKSISNNSLGILLYVFIPTVFYFVSASLTVPWYVDRYIMPIIPMASIIIVYFIHKIILLVLKNKSLIGVMIIFIAVFLCFLWHRRLEPYYLYDSPDRLEYKASCSDIEGIIIDFEDEKVNFEVELNFDHPKIFKSDNNHLDSIIENIEVGSEYCLYARKDKALLESIETLFEGAGYEVVEENFETDFYNVFHLYYQK